MKQTDEELSVIRRYLLGDLDERGRQRLEERVFTSRDYSTRVQIAEEDLIEDYLNDALDAEEQEKFVGRFLSTPGQLQKLKIAQALRGYAGANTPAPERGRARLPFFERLRPRAFALAPLAAVLLLAIILGYWFFSGGSRRRDGDNPAEARRRAVAEEVARLNPPAATGDSAATRDPNAPPLVALPPLLLRGEGKQINAPPGGVVRLRLELPAGSYESYRATLRAVGGDELFTLPGLRPPLAGREQSLELNLPANVLPPGDYLLNVSGMKPDGKPEDVADYSFRIAAN